MTLVVSFPAAGGDPGSFGWVRGATDVVHVPMTNAASPDAVSSGAWRDRAVAEIADAAGAAGDGAQRDVVLVGHSMGGLSAACVAGGVADRLGVAAVVLALNTPCPDSRGRIPTLSASTDDEIGAVMAGAGIGPEILDDPDLLAEVAEDVRADARVADELALAVSAAEPVRELHAVTTHGDTVIPADRCAAWRDRVSGRFGIDRIEGGHMLVGVSPDTLVGILESITTALRRRTRV